MGQGLTSTSVAEVAIVFIRRRRQKIAATRLKSYETLLMATFALVSLL
jgi:hypothetical protein